MSAHRGNLKLFSDLNFKSICFFQLVLIYKMLNSPIFNRKSNQKKTPIAFPPLPICPETSNDSKKNWTYLTNQVRYYFIHSSKRFSRVFSGFSRSHSPHSFCPRPPKFRTLAKPGRAPAAAARWDPSWTWSLFSGASPPQTAPASGSTTALQP